MLVRVLLGEKNQLLMNRAFFKKLESPFIKTYVILLFPRNQHCEYGSGSGFLSLIVYFLISIAYNVNRNKKH